MGAKMIEALTVAYWFGFMVALVAGLIYGTKRGDWTLFVLAPLWPILYVAFALRVILS